MNLPDIKKHDLLFESQIPKTIDTFIQGWYTSVSKLEKMCKQDPAFGEVFLSTYKKDYSQDFKFKDILTNLKTLCYDLDVFSQTTSKFTNKKFSFRNPLYRIPKSERIQVGENKLQELDEIKEILANTKQKMKNQILDIQLNWKDKSRDKFFSRMNYFANCINSLSLCCEKTQKQIQTTKR